LILIIPQHDQYHVQGPNDYRLLPLRNETYDFKIYFIKTLYKCKILLIFPISVVAIILMSANVIELQQKAAWVAPASADAMVNPLKGSAESIAPGKKLYATYCVPCHGDKGKGDGIAAASLNPKPANHSSDKVQSQSDGAIFWKLTNGRSPMASYEKILSVQQRWQLVNYIRTLKATK
jgi:mono/diheme cytochrome c family protein